jgi:hypothetical protein
MFKFTKQYPVFGRIGNDQWDWLCDHVSLPRKEWIVGKGAVWFKQEKHKTMYLLRWS